MAAPRKKNAPAAPAAAPAVVQEPSAPGPAEAPRAKAPRDHLVTVWKDGAELRVHPDTLAAHVRAGWTVAD